MTPAQRHALQADAPIDPDCPSCQIALDWGDGAPASRNDPEDAPGWFCGLCGRAWSTDGPTLDEIEAARPEREAVPMRNFGDAVDNFCEASRSGPEQSLAKHSTAFFKRRNK